MYQIDKELPALQLSVSPAPEVKSMSVASNSLKAKAFYFSESWGKPLDLMHERPEDLDEKTSVPPTGSKAWIALEKMPLMVISRSNTEPLPQLQQCRGRTPAVLPLEAVTNLQQSPSLTPRRSFHLVSMATAKFKQHFHAPHGHRLFRNNSSNVVNEPPINEEQRQKERDFICCYECNHDPLSPREISAAPGNKEVGTASKNLRVGDFELIKTIGTGMTHLCTTKVNVIIHGANASDQLDYCPGGEIFTYLRRATRFDEDTARFYVAEMVLILEFLHGHQGIAYRDMKPENMLIDAEGHLKLVDFGFAKKVMHRETYTLCGTPEYLAPEVIRNSGHGVAVDWWSLGILLYEFLVGQPPFWDNQPIKIYEKIVEGKIKYPSCLSHEAKDVIGALCTLNPSQRLGNIRQGDLQGAALVKVHPFFQKIDWDALYNRKMKGPIIPRLKGPTDASNFTDYDAPSSQCTPYTKDMQQKYDHEFKDF
ncbi:MAG: hypothetical protein Q9164_004362 [Protoblastenia rupestris]